MTKTWYIILALVVVIGGIVFFATKSLPDRQAGAPNGEPSLGMPLGRPGTGEAIPGTDTPEMIVEPEDNISGGIKVPEGISVEPITVHTIRITANGFEPSSLTVKKGDSVIWVNESGRSAWPASAVHPTHTAYPGSGIQKCGTAEAATIFDACGNVAIGNSWSFVFNEAGTWKYHDHLRASVTGSVVVE